MIVGFLVPAWSTANGHGQYTIQNMLRKFAVKCDYDFSTFDSYKLKALSHTK